MFQDYFPEDAAYAPRPDAGPLPARLRLDPVDLDWLPGHGLEGVEQLLVQGLSHETLAALPPMRSLRTLDLEGSDVTDLGWLAQAPRLEALRLAGLPVASLAGLGALRRLRFLLLTHLVEVRSLEPLAALDALEELIIATDPGWDARRGWEIDSLAPLSGLRGLRQLAIAGLAPAAGGLSPLWKLEGLEEIEISDSTRQFTLEDLAHLQAALPGARCPGPDWRYEWPNLCRRCRQEVLHLLRGVPPRARKNACPRCDAKRLAAHRAAFEAARAAFPGPG